MRRIATALCAAGTLALLGPATASAFGPVGAFDGSGTGSVQFSHPQAAAATGGTVYVADTSNNRVPFYSTAGVFQGGLSGPPSGPRDVATNGTMVVAAGPTQVVRWVAGLSLGALAPGGSSYGVALDGAGTLYVSDAQNGVIHKYNPVLGNFLGDIGAGQLSAPQGMTADATGVYVADAGNGRIVKFDANGNVLATWSMPTYSVVAGGSTFTGTIEPHDVAVDSAGRVFAPDAGTHSNLVAVFAANGSLQQIFGSPDSDPGNPCHFDAPWGLAVNGTALYVVSTGENQVRILDDTVASCAIVNFGTGGGISPQPSGLGGGGGSGLDRVRPKIKLTGFPRGCARHNFTFTIHASDDVLLKRLTLFVNHRKVANQPVNRAEWNVKVKIPVSNVRRQLPRGASVRVLIVVRVTDAAGKKAKVRRAFRICG